MQRLLASFGDKNVIIERIAQNMLTDPLVNIPTDNVMRDNLPEFISETYNRFYTRQPSEAEIWYLQNLINNNAELTVVEVYYAFLTSEEYKYY
jgi:hypothetical protein